MANPLGFPVWARTLGFVVSISRAKFLNGGIKGAEYKRGKRGVNGRSVIWRERGDIFGGECGKHTGESYKGCIKTRGGYRSGAKVRRVGKMG